MQVFVQNKDKITAQKYLYGKVLIILFFFVVGFNSVYASMNCQQYQNPKLLDIKKNRWRHVLDKNSTPGVLRWIVGLDPPLESAKIEAASAMKCMLKMLRRQSNGLAPYGAKIFSGYRDFYRQRSIWERKYTFRGQPFDKISNQARKKCHRILLSAEKHWQPENEKHVVCWHGNQTYSLTADERQSEILQASSAPGISRHHWGTDFDILDRHMNQKHWEKKGTLVKAGQWLEKNAAMFGFYRPYNASNKRDSPAYMEEGWHWSYYPVAQALLNFANEHQESLNKLLVESWQDKSQYSYIVKYWRDYMFNVNKQP